MAGKTFDFIYYCFIRARWFRMEFDLLLKFGYWVLCFKNLGNEIFILKVFCLTVRTTEVFFIQSNLKCLICRSLSVSTVARSGASPIFVIIAPLGLYLTK